MIFDQDESKSLFTINMGVIGFNWYEDLDMFNIYEVSADSPIEPGGYVFGQDSIGFHHNSNIQTSTISCYGGNIEDIKIEVTHRGGKQRVYVAPKVLWETSKWPESYITYIFNRFCQQWPGKKDHEVISQLFTKMFNGYEPPAYPMEPLYSSEKFDLIFSQRANRLPGARNKVQHPVTGRIDSLFNTIIVLNDKDKWTREQIADWIETLDININFEERKEEELPYE